jgi:hypothetical protein
LVDYTTTVLGFSNVDQVPLTTLCDGYPRYLAELEYWQSVVTITPTPTTWATQYVQGTFPQPPDCTLGPNDCFYSASANGSNPSPTQTLPCPTYAPCPTTDWVDGDAECKLYAGGVTVWYWPVSTAIGNPCAATPTVLPPPPGPRSTVIDGTAFVSPSVYVKVGTAYARIHWTKYDFVSCGCVEYNIFTSFASAEVLSTIIGKPGRGTNTKPWSLVDMLTPAPPSAYGNFPATCTVADCTTFELAPTVTLDIPSQLMTGEWRYCTPRSEGVIPVLIPLETVAPGWPPPVSSSWTTSVSESIGSPTPPSAATTASVAAPTS